MKRLICLLAACLLVFSCGMFAVSADHVHELEYVRARDARIAKPGNIAHYYCSDCGKYFADSAGEKELTEADGIGEELASRIYTYFKEKL